MSQPNKPPKTMSSRLMNMKFMQRGAAAASPSPQTPSEPASKRQRLSNGASYATPSSTPRSQSESVGDTPNAEADTPSTSTKRGYPHHGEIEWYLNIKEPASTEREMPLQIITAGYSTIDASASAPDLSSEDGEVGSAQVYGRRSFGKFNRTIEKQQNPDVSSSDSSDSDASESDGEGEPDEDEKDDPTGAKALIARSRKEAGERARAERKAKRKAEKAEATRLAEERRNKQVNLNKLTSISGGGGGGTPSRSSGSRDMKCFRCGEQGHLQKDCPRASQQRHRNR